MIKVTADIFSGRPNPQWVVTGAQADSVLQKLRQAPQATAPLDSGFNGLGNRGLVVEVLSDYLHRAAIGSSVFRLAAGGSTDEDHGREIAEQLIAGMTRRGADEHPALTTVPGEGLAAPLNKNLQRLILETLPAMAGSVITQSTVLPEKRETRAVLKPCDMETAAFNPGFWNDPAHISKNNCYNYGSNRRTDTFAQPGRATGHQYKKINCSDVTNGAVSDGASLGCAPANQAPRWYMALVIAPSWPDFHWYRLSKEGFWGHKPGGTAARNVDNSNQIIHNPQTANRGPYTVFCGYMYAQKRMVVK